MKTLLLLRHAKSSWKETVLEDHDRPLNKRGRKDAPRMGRLLAELNLIPEYLVSSSAKRARKTATEVIEETRFRGESRFTFELYHAAPGQLLNIVRELPSNYSRVLLIGHNPGLEEFLEHLTGNYTPLTTAALARVELPVQDWRQIDSSVKGELMGLWQPRELA